MLKIITSFLKAKKASISIAFAILCPVLLTTTTYFCGLMEARFIAAEVQSLMDLSTKAGANTGKIIQTNYGGDANYICMIPSYDSTDSERTNSGYFVTTNMLLENLKNNFGTSNESVYTKIKQQILSDNVGGLREDELMALGYVHLRLEFDYTPKNYIWGYTYKFNLESTSRCEIEASDKK